VPVQSRETTREVEAAWGIRATGVYRPEHFAIAGKKNHSSLRVFEMTRVALAYAKGDGNPHTNPFTATTFWNTRERPRDEKDEKDPSA
jgi:hypothetical protein